MTDFIPRQRIERLAVAYWHRHALRPGFDVDRLVDALDLGLLWEPIPSVDGRDIAAELVADERLIRLNEDQRSLLVGNAGFYRFTVAHEIGHWELHAGDVRAGGDAMLWDAGEPVRCRRLVFGRDETPSLGMSGAEARREHQAHLFASYLLAPTDVFMDAYQSIGCDGWPATLSLAENLELSGQATLVRLAEEGLGHRDENGVPRPGRRPPAGQSLLGL